VALGGGDVRGLDSLVLDWYVELGLPTILLASFKLKKKFASLVLENDLVNCRFLKKTTYLTSDGKLDDGIVIFYLFFILMFI
jgi:hypothetical protein